MSRRYDYPVYGTQGGGLVREVNGAYIFVEKPNCPGLDVGDTMPTEWDIIPANTQARVVSTLEDAGGDTEEWCALNGVKKSLFNRM